MADLATGSRGLSGPMGPSSGFEAELQVDAPLKARGSKLGPLEITGRALDAAGFGSSAPVQVPHRSCQRPPRFLRAAPWVGSPGSKCSVDRRARIGPTGQLTILSSPATLGQHRLQHDAGNVHAIVHAKPLMQSSCRGMCTTLRHAVAKGRFAGHSAQECLAGVCHRAHFSAKSTAQ